MPRIRGAWWWTLLCLLPLSIALAQDEDGKKARPIRPEEKPAAETKPADTKPAEKKGAAKKDDKAEAESPFAEKDAGGKPARPKPPVDPLIKPFSDLLKRLVPDKSDPATPATPPGGAKKDEKPKKPRHPADGRAPYDLKKAQWLSRAQGQIDRKQWGTALELLQRISDDPEDSLVQGPDGNWVSLRLEVDRLRSQAPPELLKDYRLQFDQVASDKLAAASASGDLEAFGRVAAAWFQTEAGVQAANTLASVHLDRGEFLLASRIYQRLWDSRVPLTTDSQWRVKAAYAFARTGQADLSRKLLAAGPVTLPGGEADVEKWLAAVSRVEPRPQAVVDEWPAFFGGPRRNAKSAGDEPLLLPRWSVPLTERAMARERMKNLQEDLIDSSTPAIPQLSPVMIGGRVAFRTLHGIQVVDAASGKLLWQTEDEVPVEAAITGQALTSYDAWGNMRFGGRVMMGGMANFSGDTGESGPLANLMFRNANFGLISSDGKRLFVAEDPLILSGRMPGMNWWWWGQGNEQQSGANKLTAYDLATGRPEWVAGGETNGEAFEPPLTGTFFFGPPLADRGDLFAVGEKDNEIRLYCLDPQTGRLRWGQLIGLSESSIGVDVGRRWWTSQVACSEGIIVALTTTGWVVAVDRTTHSLLWGLPLFKSPAIDENAGPNVDQQKMVTYVPLSQRWANAPPVIVGDRVILTAPSPNQPPNGDEQALRCLHLGTGKELWTKPRGDNVALAGVFGDRVLTVGHKAISATSLSDGKDLWTLKFAETGSTVEPVAAGLGVAVGPHYYLPLSSGEVWAITIDKGEVASKAYTDEGALGNLAMYEGMLLSLGLNGMTAFEQRKAVESDIVKRKSQDPDDPWARVREAEIHVLHRRHADALAELRKVDAARLSTDLAPRYRSLMVESLTFEIQRQMEDPAAAPLLDELKSFVKSPAEQRQARRLEIDRQTTLGEVVPAFESLVALATDEPAEMVPLDATRNVSVRSDLWVAGRLEDLYGSRAMDAREPLDRRIQDLATAAQDKPVEDQQQFLRLFGWHPSAHALRWKLLETFATAGEFLKAERMLQQLKRNQDEAGLARLLARRAKLLEQFGLKPDAAALRQDLVTRYPTSPEAAEIKAAGTPMPAPEAESLNWKGRPARVERIGTNYYSNNYVQTLPGDQRIPFYRRYSLEIPQQEQRLEVIDTLTDKTVWSQPLRTRTGNDGSLASCEINGYQVATLYQGVLQVISPVEKRVLWTQTSDSRNTQTYYPGNAQTPLTAMQPQLTLNNRRIRRRPLGATPLSAVNLEYVCRQERRSMTVLDALTGELLWSASNIRPGTRCYADENRLYLMVPISGPQPAGVATAANQFLGGLRINVNILGGRVVRKTSTRATPGVASRTMQLLLYRPTDGRQIDVPELSTLVDRTLDVVDGDLVLSTPRESGKPVTLKRFDPVEDVTRWSHELPADAEFTLLDDADLAVLSRSAGTLERFDLRSGERRLLGKLPPGDLRKSAPVFAFSDLDRVYLAVNTQADGMFYYGNDGLQNLRIGGMLYAFDNAAAKLAWQQKIDSNTLVLERLDHSPYLVFLTQRPRRNVVLLHVVVLEKTGGERLAEQDLTYSYSGMRNLLINATDGYVEVRGYQERVRVMAGKPPEKEPQPPATK